MTVYDMLIDFGCASLLILIGQLLRSKVKFFQEFFVPASLLAGFMGLFLGKRFLNIMPFSDSIGSYAGCFIIIVFTVVGLNGFEFGKAGGGKEEVQRIVGFQLYRLFCFFVQFIFPIAFTLLVLVKLFPTLSPGFGILLASGFTGGHGTAAAVGATFQDLGWADAMDLGITFATAGILCGVFGGLAIIKYATKKGYTSYIKDFKFINNDLRTGLVAKENRSTMGEETISSVSLDTLCFHMSLIMMLGGGGYLLNKKVLAVYVLKGIPDFTVCYILALIFFLIFKKTKLYNYVDKTVNTRISGMFTDYLVCFAVASINPTVLINYAGPLALMILLGILIVVLCIFPMGYLMNRKCWFEHSIFVYGYNTGVFAIGFVLLRIVDPENRSMTVEDTAMTPIGSFVEIIYWSAVPGMLLAGTGWVAVGLTTIAAVAMLVIAIVGKMWYPAKKFPKNARGGYNMPEETSASV